MTIYLTASMALILTTAIATPVRAQSQDVVGWGKIKWGMTFAEAKSLYPDIQSSQQATGSGQSLIFQDFEIDPTQTATITLYAEKGTSIVAIVLPQLEMERAFCR